ncbi:Heparinase II/III-like protein [Anaerohalosphaera lusitana]|uniref:Heparinase II/III-like protein n=1 Tax=Anaerohalosphaera lusitana TaxID=1936003 RepID=A0A1U9NGV6_9BACT|nr:DUF4962 domain-containing protein [Anaerohalosphaera lusitana]AQT66997.1 Heparinase II/III-like protein [Anaerohalosphaera lusitana]
MGVKGLRKMYVAAIVTLIGLQAIAAQDKSTRDDILAGLKADHPRTMLTNDRLAELKDMAQTDTVLQDYVSEVISRADRYMDSPKLEHKLRGPRLLHISRDCMNRVHNLALAYRWTGETKYADKAIDNMLTVCDFPDWNPSHFLDTAEMSNAVGTGYDWLYHYMDEKTRKKIRSGLIKLGLDPAIELYDKDKAWWTKSAFNWNQVCNGGLTVGALAVADTHPQKAEQIIKKAVETFPLALRTYSPDGAWGEGPGYWHYATMYTVFGLASMQTALGTDFGLTNIEGLDDSALFPIYTTGPTGIYVNFADAGERSRRRPMACMFWLAGKYDRQLYYNAEHKEVQKGRADPGHVMWYAPQKPTDEKVSLDKHFDGKVPVITMRSAWEDPDALFLSIKTGYNQVNHGHLDLGNFEIEALGLRWARDLGRDDYNLPGYWNSRKGGTRWTYYRLNSLSHSVPLLAGEGQDPTGKAHFIDVELNCDQPCAVLDMSSAYSDHAKRVRRGIALPNGRKGPVLIQDEYYIPNDKPTDVVWAMTTDADIKLNGSEATLTLKGEKMIARIISPSNAAFSKESAAQQPPEKDNKGVSRLLVKLDQPSGKTTIAVSLAPVWPEGPPPQIKKIMPLSRW